LGYKTDFKPIHETSNFYRFRQYDPKPGETFRTGHIGKVKDVYSINGVRTKVIGHD
jgi:hypothetical protein